MTDTEKPVGPGEDGNGDGATAPPWWRRWWVWAAAAVVVLVGVGVTIWAVQDDDNGEDTTPSTTTTTVPTTTTTSTTTTTTMPTTTTEPTTTTVEAVAAWIQQHFNDRYAQSTPPPGVAGPEQIVCSDTGPIAVGGVLACEAISTTEPGFPLEDAGLVIYVLDSSGRSAWTGGTDQPHSTEGLIESYQAAPHGLYCRDLLDPGRPDLGTVFHAGTTTPASGYLSSLVYWSLEGEPDRMDADLNGIPCETLYAPEVVAQVLAGGPV